MKAKVQDCEPCRKLGEYEYNEMYYDSSSYPYYSNSYGGTFDHPQSRKENGTKTIAEFNIETQFHCPTNRTFSKTESCQLTRSFTGSEAFKTCNKINRKGYKLSKLKKYVRKGASRQYNKGDSFWTIERKDGSIELVLITFNSKIQFRHQVVENLEVVDLYRQKHQENFIFYNDRCFDRYILSYLIRNRYNQNEISHRFYVPERSEV